MGRESFLIFQFWGQSFGDRWKFQKVFVVYKVGVWKNFLILVSFQKVLLLKCYDFYYQRFWKKIEIQVTVCLYYYEVRFNDLYCEEVLCTVGMKVKDRNMEDWVKILQKG